MLQSFYLAEKVSQSNAAEGDYENFEHILWFVLVGEPVDLLVVCGWFSNISLLLTFL